MATTKIRIDRELYGKLEQCAKAGGYSSTDEFIQHVLEKEVEQVLGREISPEEEEKAKERLRGLGYLS
jgi:hypothetical protein